MKQAPIVDIDGNLIDIAVVNELDGLVVDNGNDTFTIRKPVPQPIHKLTFNFETEEFEEGLTEAELEEIRNQPRELTETEKLQKQQTDLIFGLMRKGVL